MNPTDADERRIRARQIELLYDQSVVALAATTVAGAILVGMLSRVSAPGPLVTWSGMLVILNAGYATC